MLFRQLFDRESSTYTYLLADPASREAVLIDTVVEQLDRDLELLRQLNLELCYVLDTHVHADHVTGAGRLRERTGAKTVAGRGGAPCVDVPVSGDDRVHIGSIDVHVLSTPGHTNDSVSYLVGDRVFTGDALLIRGAGRTDFQNGDPAQLYDSLTRVLFALPDATLVYPAHDYRGFTDDRRREALQRPGRGALARPVHRADEGVALAGTEAHPRGRPGEPRVRGARELAARMSRSGGRSTRAAELLAGMGFERIFNLEGGMLAVNALNLPVER